MPLHLLAVSVGNTRTRVGAFVDDQLSETATLSNDPGGATRDAIEKAWQPLQERDDAVVVMGSVNPAAAERIEAELASVTGRDVLRAERDVPIPVGRQLDREAKVGEDRLLNAAAAFDVLQQACVVVDAGTALTVDFVDGAGTFHGGAISPGGQLMLDSLHQRTALLPELTLAKPDEALGHNTAQAMHVGVYHGLRGTVRELVELFAERAGTFPMVIATGGDAPLLFADYPLIDRVVPDLTLMGLAVALRKQHERGDGEG